MWGGYGGCGKGGGDDMVQAVVQGVMQQLFQKGGGGGGWGGGGGKGWGSGKGGYRQNPPDFHDTSGGILGEHVGEITARSFKYGFIEAPALKAMGYGAAFALGSELKEYKQGHTVKFTAYLDKTGKLRAKDLKSGFK
eukprot:TRINITY_DN6807_c0_g1_i2.p1 TRINITY_DN6807_c0_g1~~TRINITY_DN6807_c0_g1_i2.p1  ORF type:complete len:137 (+),score=37.43 TRINITY_DN6807_c0_g1_i2:54-464(+)